jgi:hypothetical protein
MNCAFLKEAAKHTSLDPSEFSGMPRDLAWESLVNESGLLGIWVSPRHSADRTKGMFSEPRA